MPSVKIEKFAALVGQHLGNSDWITVDQSRIDAFADVTEDHQFIHQDPERAAAETPFGGTIAHGYLSLSLMTKMIYDVVPDIEGHPVLINYGLNKVRFLTPVSSGARIRGNLTLSGLSERKAGGYLAEYLIKVEIENHEKPALIATSLGLLT
jgi:acyl dehydratase